MDLNDIYLSLTYKKDVYTQQDIEGEFTRKMLGGADRPFYRVEDRGVIYVYAILYDFRAHRIIQYVSKLVLNRKDNIPSIKKLT